MNHDRPLELSGKMVDAIIEAIDFCEDHSVPDFITVSREITWPERNPLADVILEKFNEDGIKPFTPEEVSYIIECLQDYMIYLKDMLPLCKKGTADHKKIHSSIDRVRKTLFAYKSFLKSIVIED